MLKPVCPLCRKDGRGENRLEIYQVLKQDDGDIDQGILTCTHPQCRCEYPIIDGVPVIVADIRHYVTHSAYPIIRRNDLSESLESLIGDCMGPGSVNDLMRQHLSSYGYDHYEGMDSGASVTDDRAKRDGPADGVPGPGACAGLMLRNLEGMNAASSGPIIDLGCSVGRTTFEVARYFKELTLGIDLNFNMIKAAASVLKTGFFSYPKRKTGMVYEQRCIKTPFKAEKNVDFWACDVLNLPFSRNQFGFAVSMNLLDCVSEPFSYLQEVERILKPGGQGLMSTPYDWNTNAVPVENWLGGHSQRAESGGRSEVMIRSLFAGGSHSHALKQLGLVYEKENQPWPVRVHERSTMQYLVHVMGIEKHNKGTGE